MEAASALDVAVTSYASYERKGRTPSFQHFVEWTDIFQILGDRLTGWTGQREIQVDVSAIRLKAEMGKLGLSEKRYQYCREMRRKPRYHKRMQMTECLDPGSDPFAGRGAATENEEEQNEGEPLK